MPLISCGEIGMSIVILWQEGAFKQEVLFVMISTVTCSILAVVFDAPSHHFNVQKLLQ